MAAMQRCTGENVEITHCIPLGRNVDRLVCAVRGEVRRRPPLMIVIADSGAMFGVDPNGPRASRVLARRRSWCVGTYDLTSTMHQIRQDVTARLLQMLGEDDEA